MPDNQVDPKLMSAIHHVVHDYANFASSARMRRTGKDSCGNALLPPVNTHVGHAFYLNCRKIADFLQNKNGRENDDVLAGHYVPGFKACLPTNDKLRGPLNKQLAHVTYTRISDPHDIQPAECDQMEDEIRSEWRRFLRELKKLNQGYADEFERNLTERKNSEFRHCDLD